jgi:hypothetical protein
MCAIQAKVLKPPMSARVEEAHQLAGDDID